MKSTAWYSCLVILLLSIVAFVLFGILGIGRDPDGFQMDFKYIYKAGLMWLEGQSPYDIESFQNSNLGVNFFQNEIREFAYPPNISLLAVFLGFMPFDIASNIFILTNVICLLYVAYICNSYFRIQKNTTTLLLIAVCIGNPFTAHVVWMGQTSLIVLTLILLGWVMSQEQRPVLSGIFWGTSFIKPHFALLPFLVIFLSRKYKVIFVSFLVLICMWMVPFIFYPYDSIFELAHQWFSSLKEYESSPVNVVHFQHRFGIQNLLWELGLPHQFLEILGLIAVIVLWFFQSHFKRDDLVAITLSLSVLFLPAHDYDLVLTLPLIFAITAHIEFEKEKLCVFVFFLFVLFFPQRFLRVFEIGVILRLRELVVVILTSWLIQLSFMKKKREKLGIVKT